MSDGFNPFIQEPGGGAASGGGVTLGATWKFSTTITDADPGNKRFRLDNATQPNATFLFIDDIADSGVDASALLGSLKSGTLIYFQATGDAAKFHFATMSGDAIPAAGYTKLPITISSSGTALANNDDTAFVFYTGGPGGGTPTALPFIEVDITAGNPAANDPMHVQTGTFDTAGAQTVASISGLPLLPATGALFVGDSRIKVFIDGIKASKGVNSTANRDVYWVSTTKLAFEEKLKNTKSLIYIEAPSS